MAKNMVVFDIETRIDKILIRQTQYHDLDITDDDAYQRFRAQILEETQGRSDFIPVPYHVPISLAIGLVGNHYELLDVTSLKTDCGDAHPPEYHLTRQFWSLVNQGAQLVTFNGRAFDLPVLELHALKYGFQAQKYWNGKARYRYSDEGHLDLYDVLCNTGAVHLRGGLNTVAAMLGYIAKDGVDGSDVQGLWDSGQYEVIHTYCQRDVITSYAIFLRLELIRGRLHPAQYEAAVKASEPFLARIRPSSSGQPTLF